MLETRIMDSIRATVPLLRARGSSIATCFYRRMFADHPELLHLFNPTHQRQGRQPEALAETLAIAAGHIRHLNEIMPLVRRIAHKHRSIGVRPEQYPIVGKYLLTAMKEVLGDAITPEMLRAWKTAYERIAELFIRVEQGLYEEVKRQPGGWEGFRPFTVVSKVEESETITSFYLKPEDGQAIASFQPGQYISIRLTVQGIPYTQIRQYSLSDAPGKDTYRISVKREDGDGKHPPGIVSTHLHRRVQPGDLLHISAPAGDFVLEDHDDRPVVLISGGVGFTPLMSMLLFLLEHRPGRNVTWIHAAKNGKVHAMKRHIARLESRHPRFRSHVCYSQPDGEDRLLRHYHREGRIDREWIASIPIDPEADFYLCGPLPFMKHVSRILEQWGAKPERIRHECFGPTVEWN